MIKKRTSTDSSPAKCQTSSMRSRTTRTPVRGEAYSRPRACGHRSSYGSTMRSRCWIESRMNVDVLRYKWRGGREKKNGASRSLEHEKNNNALYITEPKCELLKDLIKGGRTLSNRQTLYSDDYFSSSAHFMKILKTISLLSCANENQVQLKASKTASLYSKIQNHSTSLQ